MSSGSNVNFPTAEAQFPAPTDTPLTSTSAIAARHAASSVNEISKILSTFASVKSALSNITLFSTYTSRLSIEPIPCGRLSSHTVFN